MTTKNSNNEKNYEQPDAERCLQLSVKLDNAIHKVLMLPYFREIIDNVGESAATMEAVKFLRKTHPELFDSKNPGDGLAFLFTGME